MDYKIVRDSLLKELKLKKGNNIKTILKLSNDIASSIRFSQNQLAWIESYILQSDIAINRHLQLDLDFKKAKIKYPDIYAQNALIRTRAYAYIFVLSTEFNYFTVINKAIDFEKDLPHYSV